MTEQNSDECRIENSLNFLREVRRAMTFFFVEHVQLESREISKLKTERIEPQIRTCVQSYKLQMAMQKDFVHQHSKDSASWDMPEVQSLVSDPRVHSIDGPMCRWSLKAQVNEKVEFMRKQRRDGSRVPREIAEVLRGDGRWKRDRRHVHMTGKSETACEYPASLVVAMLSAIKRQMISDGAIRVWRNAFCRSSAG